MKTWAIHRQHNYNQLKIIPQVILIQLHVLQNVLIPQPFCLRVFCHSFTGCQSSLNMSAISTCTHGYLYHHIHNIFRDDQNTLFRAWFIVQLLTWPFFNPLNRLLSVKQAITVSSQTWKFSKSPKKFIHSTPLMKDCYVQYAQSSKDAQ